MTAPNLPDFVAPAVTIALSIIAVVQSVELRRAENDRDDYMAWFERQLKENAELWRRYHRTKKRLDQAEDALIEAMKKPRAKS